MSDESDVAVSTETPSVANGQETAQQDVNEKSSASAKPEAESKGELDLDEDDESKGEKKRAGGFQRRISELTRQREEERREKERLLSLVERLTVNGKDQQDSSKGSELVEPTREQFESYEDYLEARAAYRAEKTLDARLKALEQSRTEEAMRARQYETQRAWDSKVSEAAQKMPDFVDVVAGSTAPTTPAMTQAIIESEAGPQILYHLAQNPAEAARIASLSPASQAREIGKLEDRVTRPAKASSAPEPIKPVGSRSQVSDLLSDKLPFDQWAKNFEKSFYRDRR